MDVAKVLGYSSPQFVSNWERGLVSPLFETISTLVDLYKIPRGEIVDHILKETRTYLESEISVSSKKTQVESQRNNCFFEYEVKLALDKNFAIFLEFQGDIGGSQQANACPRGE